MTVSAPGSELIPLRRRLHEHAELAGKEHTTSRIIQGFLEDLRCFELITGIGGNGLAAVLRGQEEGPTVLVRAELDAVPVSEIEGRSYRSRNAGVCHACGHDGHMAMLCGLASRLAAQPPRRGRVVLVLQPAEENGSGARVLLNDARMTRLQADWAFALHNLPSEPLGAVVLRTGSFSAGSVGLTLALKGRSSHAAHPELGRSPALAVAELIQELSALSGQVGGSRQLSLVASQPDGPENGLAMVTAIHARLGRVAFGTSPGDAEVMATLRSDSSDTLELLRNKTLRVAKVIAAAHRLELASSWHDEFPVTVNHAAAIELAERAARDQGLEVVVREEAFRWSEDFGWFTRSTPGALLGLGAGFDCPPLHSPDYDFPDALLQPGVAFLERLITLVLQRGSTQK